MNSTMKQVRRLSVAKAFGRYGILIGFFAIVAFLSVASPIFLKASNLVNILRQVSIIGIVSMGMTMVIILGGIDLSVGSGLALVGVVSSLLAKDPALPLFVPVVAGIATGGAVGLFNGVVIAKGRIVPFIVTLGTMTMARGLAFILAKGMPVGGLAEKFFIIGSGTVLGVPFLVVLFFAVFGLMAVVMRRTVLGRHVYAIGGNETAALASGIDVDRTKIAAYTILGLLVGVAGVVLASRIKSGQPAVASGYELDAIAACVIGGVSFLGGIGGAAGTLLGTLIIGVINNGLDLLNVQTFYQQIIKGAIIIVAVLMDRKRSAGSS
ncbi:MAG: ABC transporter permease [Spirochaetes bacterium]|nr:ABC transporter permease [Spirochaetota bacterium]MBU1081015.1 ABC transporter permease [Spirochaetota bacterium]